MHPLIDSLYLHYRRARMPGGREEGGLHHEGQRHACVQVQPQGGRADHQV